MPRSAADATRFTATGPHAHSNPHLSASAPPRPPPPSSSAPPPPPSSNQLPHETPQQKVARLRAAAQQARLSKVSTFDKVVVSGRTWADRVHRFAALGLIGITALSGVYAAVALTDMLMFNRRKRNEWLADQKARYPQLLAEARHADEQGQATDEQRRLLVMEDRIRQAEQDRAQRKLEKDKLTTWQSFREWLFSGMARDEAPLDRGLVDGGSVAETEQGLGGQHATSTTVASLQTAWPSQDSSSSTTLTTSHALDGKDAELARSLGVERKGGMLDRLGDGVQGGWRTWFRGTGKDGGPR
ncbi:MAG: hypothetical protein M1825_001206 [Sarcosagium campestre]|nr:MAG: hypothetical protein M1825_001206 [Sarcosagium campestre]